MNLRKTTAAIAAAALILTPAFGINAYAADSTVNVKPTFSEFNSNDVNGSVIVSVSGSTTADVEITADTPEGVYDYYSGKYAASDGSSYNFKIEGNDDRTYTIVISVEDTALNLSSGKYTETFTMPDGDFGASKINYSYILKTSQEKSDEDYDAVKSESTSDGVKTVQTVITFYLEEGFTKGDVNEDGNIDAIDASIVLAEYANIATSKPETFTSSQKKAADVNEDGNIDALDASAILSYYAAAATGKTPSWS
jgi:hypothetical protein